MAESLCVRCLLYSHLTHLCVNMAWVARVALHCAPFTSRVTPFPWDLDGVFWVQVPEVPAQHVSAAELLRASWERAPDQLLSPHPLRLVAGARRFLQEIICYHDLLVYDGNREFGPARILDSHTIAGYKSASVQEVLANMKQTDK